MHLSCICMALEAYNDRSCIYQYMNIGNISVSINRITVSSVPVLTAQQLSAFSDLINSVPWVHEVTWDRYNFNIPCGHLGKVCHRVLLM